MTERKRRNGFLGSAVWMAAFLCMCVMGFCITAHGEGIGETTYEPLTQWIFSADGERWSEVTLPHSCSAQDCESPKMYRGKTFYQRELDIGERMPENRYLLLFEAVGQVAEIRVNGTSCGVHVGGYTPFVVDITEALVPGSNILEVVADNSVFRDVPPVSGDFAIPNGIYRQAYLVTCRGVGFDLAEYGVNGMRLLQREVSQQSAKLEISSLVRNDTDRMQHLQITTTVLDAQDNPVASAHERAALPAHALLDVKQTLQVDQPHLWSGLEDPYLYTVEHTLSADGEIISTIRMQQGLRYFGYTDEGFFLNGRLYPLHGVSLQLDAQDVGAAYTQKQWDELEELLTDLGTPYLRLSHYPHNQQMYDLCDRLGIIVECEVPWVSDGDETPQYFDNIRHAMVEMIQSYGHHTSILFWELGNEIHPQDGKDKSRIIEWINGLYAQAKQMDPTRLVGLVADDEELTIYCKLDWNAQNMYYGWYTGRVEEIGSRIDSIRERRIHEGNGSLLGVSEYGAGGNPFHHSDDPMITTQRAWGGARHDEEFQSLFHEIQFSELLRRPWIGVTSMWNLRDFAAPHREEGGIHGQNDKGLVTRDMTVRKDAYYLYKAYFQQGKLPVVYITSRRFENRAQKDIPVKVYSNADSLRLYVNGVLTQTLTEPDAGNQTGMVWSFAPLAAVGQIDVRVEGLNAAGEVIETDEVVWHNAYDIRNGFSVSLRVYGMGEAALYLNDRLYDPSEPVAYGQEAILRIGENSEHVALDQILVNGKPVEADPGETAICILEDTRIEVFFGANGHALVAREGEHAFIATDIPRYDTENMAIELMGSVISYSDKTGTFFGCRYSMSSHERFGLMIMSSREDVNANTLRINNGETIVTFEIYEGQPFVIHMEPEQKSLYTLDGLSDYSRIFKRPVQLQVDLPLYLFANNTNGEVDNFGGSQAIYYCRIWKDGELLRCYIPAVDDTGTACMYEAVTEQFIYSANEFGFDYT